MLRGVRAVGVAACLSCLLAACPGGSPAPASGDEQPPQIQQNVHVSPQTASDAVTVLPDRLVFPAAGNQDLLSRAPGDVLVGQRGHAGGKNNPMGYLRKVVSAASDGTNITVMTAPAHLGDVFKGGRFRKVAPIFGPGAQSQAASGVRIRDTGGLAGGQFDLTQSVAFNDFSQGGIEINAQLTRGSLDLNGSLDIGAGFTWYGSLDEFHTIANFGFDASAALQVTVTASQTIQGEEELKSPKYPLGQSWFVVFVGPVPVEITAQLVLTAGCDVTFQESFQAELGAQASSQLSVGARWNNGNWSPVNQESFSFSPIGPNLMNPQVGFQVKCFVQPELDILFYDTVGPFISVDPYDQLSLTVPAPPTAPSWTLTTGVEANAGGQVQVAGDTLAQISLSLFDVSQPVAQGQLCVPQTCASYSGQCGTFSDGCNGLITCTCDSGQTCTSSGTCCTPLTCQPGQCGPLPDGCGGVIDCGGCTAPQTCGGGGSPGQCGCTPLTCAQALPSCGPLPDQCGGTIDCGSSCPSGQTCYAGTCCTPLTCAQANACGPVSDGCGGNLSCTTCPSGEYCNPSSGCTTCASGTCTAKTCSDVVDGGVAQCGTYDNGCCGTVNCGTCPSGQCCNGGSCISQGATCGTRTCGTVQTACGPISCGTCASGDVCSSQGGCCPMFRCRLVGPDGGVAYLCGTFSDACTGTTQNCGSCASGTCVIPSGQTGGTCQ